MNLIDVDGRLINIRFLSLFQPRRVAPFVTVQFVILGSRSRSCFAVKSVRVGLVDLFAGCRNDMIFVVVIDADIGADRIVYALISLISLER